MENPRRQLPNTPSEREARDIDERFISAIFGEHYTAAYVYKKTQRLASAIYLVTSHAPAEEPLRDELRRESLALLRDVLALCGLRGAAEGGGGLARVRERMFKLLSLLDLALNAGFISEMNVQVLKREYGELGRLLEARGGELAAAGGLAGGFFDVAASERADAPPTQGQKDTAVKKDKRQTDVQRQTEQIGHSQKEKTHKVHTQKNTRRDIIMDLLRRKERINVKDVSAVILDCSEKTLQRELLALVREGVLNKEGERRWSTYTLAASGKKENA